MNAARLLGSVAAVSLLVTSEPPRFTPVQPELLGAGSTLVNAWADYDGDGDVDLFVGFNGTPNRLYRNDSGTLVDVASAMGVADARATRGGAWGDFDGDGDPDLARRVRAGTAIGAAPVSQRHRQVH